MSTPPAAPLRIALVGDHDPHITAHRAIPLALRLAGEALGLEIAFDWLASDRLPAEPALERYDGFWCVPGSPYRDADGSPMPGAGAGRSSVPAPASSTRSSSSPATPSAGRRRPMARSIRTATRR